MVRQRERVSYLIVGWFVFLLYAYPGYTSPDSLLQLAEARSG